MYFYALFVCLCIYILFLLKCVRKCLFLLCCELLATKVRRHARRTSKRISHSHLVVTAPQTHTHTLPTYQKHVDCPFDAAQTNTRPATEQSFNSISICIWMDVRREGMTRETEREQNTIFTPFMMKRRMIVSSRFANAESIENEISIIQIITVRQQKWMWRPAIANAVHYFQSHHIICL